MVEGRKPVIGMDLGAAYCCAGIWENGGVRIFADEEGNKKIPSCVASANSGMIFGSAADAGAETNPAIYAVKRLIGRKFEDDSVQADIKTKLWPFEVRAVQDRPAITVMCKGIQRRFSPEEITAMLLVKMRQVAEENIGCIVENVVISVPSQFNNSQRLATMNAAKIAGLKVLRILNSTSAAAIAYGVQNEVQQTKNILIFDMGGSCTDMSLVKMGAGGRKIEVIATAGDTSLGGVDFDVRMMSALLKKFKENFGIDDLITSPASFMKLRKECERAKRSLSLQKIERVTVLHKGSVHTVEICRSELNELNKEVFVKCESLLKNLLRDVQMNGEVVDEMVLIGGCSRNDKLHEILEAQIMGKEVQKNFLNPDEAVACGCAIFGASLSLEGSDMTGLQLNDVTGTSFSLDKAGLSVTPTKVISKIVRKTKLKEIITKSHAIPAKMEVTYMLEKSLFQTRKPSLIIYEGVSKLCCFELGIPTDARSIKFLFRVDVNGMLSVAANVEVEGTRKTNKIIIKNDMFTLTEKEIEKMVLDCAGFKGEAFKVANKRKAQLALEAARIQSEAEQARIQAEAEQARIQAEAEEEKPKREAVAEQPRREAEARVRIDIWGSGYKLLISIFILIVGIIIDRVALNYFG